MYSSAIYPSNFCSLINGDVTLSRPLDHVTIAALPMFHSYGILMYFAHALTVGFKMVVMIKFNLDEYVRLVEQYAVCF